MKKHDVTEATDTTPKDFEAPQLTIIGESRDVVQGAPFSGWDHRGLLAPEFEFESDDE